MFFKQLLCPLFWKTIKTVFICFFRIEKFKKLTDFRIVMSLVFFKSKNNFGLLVNDKEDQNYPFLKE